MLLLLGPEALTAPLRSALLPQIPHIDCSPVLVPERAWQAQCILLCSAPGPSLLRMTLQGGLLQAGLAFAVLSLSDDPARATAAALQAWQRRLQPRGLPADTSGPVWRHHCARCGDGDCEQQLWRARHPARPG